jgi:hypothetical protein
MILQFAIIYKSTPYKLQSKSILRKIFLPIPCPPIRSSAPRGIDELIEAAFISSFSTWQKTG